MADDPYQVLGVDQGADLAQIRRAYLALLRASHPDIRPGDVEAEARTRELNHAWEQVRNRHGRGRPGGARAAPSRTRSSTAAYSQDRVDFRSAFTAATLRIALLVLALGLVLVAIAR